jgi:hypothetical protein
MCVLSLELYFSLRRPSLAFVCFAGMPDVPLQLILCHKRCLLPGHDRDIFQSAAITRIIFSKAVSLRKWVVYIRAMRAKN